MIRSRLGIPAIVLLLCAISTLYYINTETSRLQVTSSNQPDNFVSSENDDTSSSPGKPGDGQQVEIKACDCWRRFSKPPSTERSVRLETNTCSHHSHLRGTHQQVISFSYYEKNKRLAKKRIKTGNIKKINVFFQGLQINLDLLPKLYPGQYVVQSRRESLVSSV